MQRKVLLGIPTTHDGVAGLATQICFQFQLLIQVHPGGQKMMAQVLESLQLVWETLADAQALGFTLPQPSVWWAFEEEPDR